MEDSDRKNFSYYTDKIRDYINELELEIETLTEIVKHQNKIIAELTKEKEN